MNYDNVDDLVFSKSNRKKKWNQILIIRQESFISDKLKTINCEFNKKRNLHLNKNKLKLLIVFTFLSSRKTEILPNTHHSFHIQKTYFWILKMSKIFQNQIYIKSNKLLNLFLIIFF